MTDSGSGSTKRERGGDEERDGEFAGGAGGDTESAEFGGGGAGHE